VVKYLWPGKRLKSTGVPTSSLLLAGVVGIVGFFVVPVVGLVLGFALGVYASERVRLGTHAGAWSSTGYALRAAALSILLELAAGLVITVVWVAGLVVS